MSSVDALVSQVSFGEWPAFDAAGRAIAAHLDALEGGECEMALLYGEDGILRLFTNNVEALAIPGLSQTAAAAVVAVFQSALDGTCEGS